MQPEPTAHPAVDKATAELLAAIRTALAIPAPASVLHWIAYYRTRAERAEPVLGILESVLERGEDPAEAARRLVDELDRFPTNTYRHADADHPTLG